MSRKPETQFVTGVHAYLPPLSELHREKTANPYRGGMADWWYSGRHDVWIEWKYIREVPKKLTTRVVPELSGLQLEWLTRRRAEGRNVHVFVGSPKGAVWYRHDEWEKGISTAEYRDRLNTRKETAEIIVRLTKGTA